jgi:hypothetical protein
MSSCSQCDKCKQICDTCKLTPPVKSKKYKTIPPCKCLTKNCSNCFNEQTSNKEYKKPCYTCTSNNGSSDTLWCVTKTITEDGRVLINKEQNLSGGKCRNGQEIVCDGIIVRNEEACNARENFRNFVPGNRVSNIILFVMFLLLIVLIYN